VLDPVDGAAAVSIVASANAQGVPVVSYDRLVLGGTLAYYVSFDNEKVGALQGTALIEGLERQKATGGILMVNGSPTDHNAGDFKAGALSTLEPSDFDILAQFDTPDWSPDKAQEWVAGQLTQYSGRYSAIYAANDGTASGAVAALKAANVSPWPLVTGQDAELSAIQRIVAGEQYMTVYKAIRFEAEKAAEVAVALARGEQVTGDTVVEGSPTASGPWSRSAPPTMRQHALPPESSNECQTKHSASSPCAASASASARCRRSATSTSRSTRARWSPSSATTARASRRS
jgi:D-xylose transport system substrate-binding protein